MTKRGDHIKNLKFKKRREVEAKINRYLLRNKDKIENPVRCFVTFEHTEGRNLFIQMASPHYDETKISAHEGIVAEEAPIPSNIIW